METSRKFIKFQAKTSLRGNYPTVVGTLVIVTLTGIFTAFLSWLCILLFVGLAAAASGTEEGIKALIAGLSLVLVLFVFFTCLLLPGFSKQYLNLCLFRQAHITDIFWGFQEHCGKFFGIALLVSLIYGVVLTPVSALITGMFLTKEWKFVFVFLFFYNILLKLFGLWIWLNYGQFYLILANDPKKSIFEALAESRELMKGNRRRFLILNLSFAGWFVAACFTFGIGFLWLFPYLWCTNCWFYINKTSGTLFYFDDFIEEEKALAAFYFEEEEEEIE